ncbi:MAG TPA: hypothetical protein VGF33_03080 [Caulobacteraceae bacterium]|jgi:hypothetical protein
MIEIDRLRARVAELEDENLELYRQLHEAEARVEPLWAPLSRRLRVPPTAAIIAATLVERAPMLVSLERLNAICEENGRCYDALPGRCTVQLSIVRRKLRPYGVVIHNSWAKGWWISEADAQQVRGIAA